MTMTSSDLGLFVQYGCGLCAPDGWINFDASPTLLVGRVPVIGALLPRKGPKFPPNVRFGDVRRGLPVETASCRAVYASHVLEHLALDDFNKALAETFRILRPGGIFRLVVPDLEAAARKYLDNLITKGSDAAPIFMRETHLGWERRPKGLGQFLREWLGNSRHLWMWDYRSLSAALQQHGFVDIRRAQFGDSSERAFAFVEDPGRFVDACAMEARRPER